MTNVDTFEWKHYVITKGSIGKGAFSKVYYGYNTHTNQEIAMKKIHFAALQDNIKDKVISEITILQKMNHVNIMKLYEYHFDGEYIVLITEYCATNLDKWMKEKHSYDEIIAVITQIVRGIRYMHNNNILHRDIKPENILIHNHIIKLCDFGFSIIIKEQYEMMQTFCGTPIFMSPELLFLKPYTIKSEIWALGVLFYMMIYQTHPFGKLTSLDEYRTKIRQTIIFISIDELDYLITMIQHMLQIDEHKRPDINTIVKTIQHRGPIPNTEDIFVMDECADVSVGTSFGIGTTLERHVTGRSTNVQSWAPDITNDYFTPPELQFDGKRQTPSSRSSSLGSSRYLSMERISAFFSFRK